MKVIVTEPVQIVLRNLSEDERRRVLVWFENLGRWETDSFVRKHSKKLDGGENVYMLLTSTDIRIFFTLGQDLITILDVAKKATIVSSGQASGAD
jgi:hypothetical protein